MFITLDLTNVYGQTKIEIPEQKNLLILQTCFFSGATEAVQIRVCNQYIKDPRMHDIFKAFNAHLMSYVCHPVIC